MKLRAFNSTRMRFKGEERELNKDAVQTFLYKWSGIHELRGTSYRATDKETSLSLKRKVYKWWVSFPLEARPKSSDQFKTIFCKLFLPEQAIQELDGLGHLPNGQQVSHRLYLQVHGDYTQIG